MLSRNPKTGKVNASQVGTCTRRVAGAVIAITLTDAQTGQSQTVVASPEHPFFVDGKGFVAAASLGIGTSIVTRAGPYLTVTAVEERHDDKNGYAVYNFTVPRDHTYFVGTLDGGAWVHNPLTCTYPVHFETELDPTVWGTNDRTHFQEAGKALQAAMKSDSALVDHMATISGKSPSEITAAVDIATRKGRSPAGFTWHHATQAQAGGRAGVMQLVVRSGHSRFHGFYYPTKSGGYEEWAIPAGARARR